MTQAATLDLAEGFRTAMRRIAATVSIVTAAPRVGMAATSVTSLTLEPPALLVCVKHTASLHAHIARLGTPFCVNVLAGSHGDLSMAFGGRASQEERFTIGDWREDERGIPWLADAQACLFCSVDALMDYGSHTIVIGRAQAVRLHGQVDPLIYGDGRYARL